MISSKKTRDEEWHWIESMKSGDSRAYSHFFQLLYEKHSGRLFTLCLGYSRCREDAEEELQEIFITLMRGLPFFRNEASFSTWSTRIAINHMRPCQHPAEHIWIWFSPKLFLNSLTPCVWYFYCTIGWA